MSPALGRNLAVMTTRRSAGELEVALHEVTTPQVLSDDDLVVEVLAAPVNPSDVGPLLGGADPTTARREDPGAGLGAVLARTVLTVPGAASTSAEVIGGPSPLGSEGAGRVVAAGTGPEAQALLGRLVAVLVRGTYSRYVKVAAGDTIVLGDDVAPAAGAAAFINPLTALGMVETTRQGGSPALVHTAAASNLGRMLHRLCLEERIGLVNVVRSPEQVRLMRSLGAEHVVDTTAPGFAEDLVAAVGATGATVAFDAVGGGPLASQVLSAMDQAAVRGGAPFPHGPQYGTATPKEVHVYGGLQPGPTVIDRTFGTTWSIAGWLLFPFLERIGSERAAQLRRRVATSITTTFASSYTRTLALGELLDPDVLRAVSRRATGEKHLIDPSL